MTVEQKKKREFRVLDTILTKGNDKIDRSCFIYSHTPIVGCGKGCKVCKQTCYAVPLYKMRKQVKAKWDRNLALSKTNKFYSKFSDELKTRHVKTVRLMQAGDFYNNDIINKFYRIIRDNKDVTFYGYTKNKNALILNDLPNCNILYSFVNGYRNYGSVEYCNLLHQKFGTHICDLDEEHGEKCMKNCKVCSNKCASKNGVCFIQHGMYKNDLSYEKAVMEELKSLPDYVG